MASESKEERKAATQAARKRDEFEVTPFGRRRRPKGRNVLVTVTAVALTPFVFLYRRLWRKKPEGTVLPLPPKPEPLRPAA